MVKLGNDSFDIVNNWLGWGDPKEGLWIIGMEERKVFDEKNVSSRKGQKFAYETGEKDLNWKVANTTAKLLAIMLNCKDHATYRDNILWRKGSRVFNGNLLPLGKPHRNEWPEEVAAQYKEFFEVDCKAYLEAVKKNRYAYFRKFRKEERPQAIVCFGKGFWPKYTKLFVEHDEQGREYKEYHVTVFEQNQVILTGHFSYGRWMPNKSIEFVAEKLTRWGVTPGTLGKEC